MNLKNKGKKYHRLLKDYDKIPKAVLAAIAVSYALMNNNENFEMVEADIKYEWGILYACGIVHQKPIK